MTELRSTNPGPTDFAVESALVEMEMRQVGEDSVYAAICRLNRPDSLNALNWETVLELEQALLTLDADPAICTIFVTGRGRAFSAGGDLKAYRELQRDPIRFPKFSSDFHRTLGRIREMRKPVVALVNGVAAAGGLELLLSCDFAYAAESAQIGDLHVKFGQMGGGGVLSLLPRMIGPAKARELVFSGALLDAHEAEQWGLVNRVVSDSSLIETGLEFARGIATRSPRAIMFAKDVMNSAYAEGTGLGAALRLERESTARYCLTLPDAHEGLAAFAERRTPNYPRELE